MGRNARLVFGAKTARTFCYGFLGVLFPVYLTRLGLGPGELGVAITLTLLSSAVMTYLVRWPAERYGIRTALLLGAALIAVSAALFMVARDPWMVVAAAMLGNLAVGTGETGPFLALEQVVVARDASRAQLTWVLSFYNLAGYAASALGASLVGQGVDSPRLLFGLFMASAVVQ